MLSYNFGIYGPFCKRGNFSLFIPHLISFMWSVQDILILTHLVDFSGLLLSRCNSWEWPPGGAMLEKGLQKWNGITRLSLCAVDPGPGRVSKRDWGNVNRESIRAPEGQESWILLIDLCSTHGSRFPSASFKHVTGTEMRSRHGISWNQYSRQAKCEMAPDHLQLVGRSKVSLQRGPFLNAPSSFGGEVKFERFFS